jgi:hypothetical protein
MGTSLSGQTPSQTYKDILQISNSNAGIPTGLRAVSDGNGADSALKICTTGVDINGIFSISGTVLTSTASEINKLDRNSGDGYIEANKAVIAGSSRNIYFNGGDANLLGSGVYQNGNIINANLDSISYAGYQVSATGSTPTGSFIIYPASGVTQKVILNQPLTQISISGSAFISQDASGTTGLPATYFRDYHVTLVTIQDAAGAREVDFNSSIIWPRTQWASGYSKPRLNPGYNATGTQMDIFEFRSFDYGGTWYGNYVASGLLSSSAGALSEAIIDGGSF